MTGNASALAQESLRARLQDHVTASRALMSRVGDVGRAQMVHARTARARTTQQRTRLVAGWLTAHGVAAPGEPLSHADAVQLVLDAAEIVYEGCASISVTTVDQLEGDRHPLRTVGSTGVARSVDALQFALREGPCIDAVELDAVSSVRADDLAGDEDARCWPRLCRAIRGSGVRSSLSIAVPWSALHSGLQTEQRAMSSINLYAAEPHALDRSEATAILLGSWAGSIMSGRDLSALLDSSG